MGGKEAGGIYDRDVNRIKKKKKKEIMVSGRSCHKKTTQHMSQGSHYREE